MAKDDYHVIVYQILAYLYNQLKHGAQVDKQMIGSGSPLFAKINEQYWEYIIFNMSNMGLIDGIAFIHVDGKRLPYIHLLEECLITPAGIEYLCENSFMKKVKNLVKDIADIVPISF